MREKNKNGGYVFFNKQRKNWSAQYYDFNTSKGKNVLKTKSFKTEEEANKFLGTIMYQKMDPLYIEHNGIPLGEFMKAMLKRRFDFNQISGTQYRRVLQTITQIEKIPLGRKLIDQITSDEVQAYMNSFKHLSNSSIDKIFNQLNQAFISALNKGYILKNPMINVIKPRSQKPDKEVRALTFEEQQLFTDYLLERGVNKCKYKNVFLIQMYMGLRVGETLALTTHDINLKRKKMNIYRTLTVDENGMVIMGTRTKTYAGKRLIPIPDFMMPHIIEQMKIANNQDDNPEKLLFKPDNKRYTYRGSVNDELKRLLKRHFGIGDISTHSLRHTYGTRCIEAGMAPVVVQKLMGHTDVGITLNTYTSVFDKFKEKEIDKMNQYFLEEKMIDPKYTLSEYNDLEQ